MAFSLRSITLNTGESIDLGPLTIVVGANNVGKSRLLREINDYITTRSTGQVIIRSLALALPPAESMLSNPELKPKLRAADNALHISLLGSRLANVASVFLGHQPLFDTRFLTNWDDDPMAAWIANRAIGNGFVAYLTTESRLSLTRAASSSRQFEDAPQSLLQRLFDIPGAEDSINDELIRLFGTKIRLDYSDLSTIKLRVGVDIDTLPKGAREAKADFQHYELLDDQGDGLRAFSAVYLTLKAIGRPLLLIDEPEAFLHPPQSYALGKLCGQMGDVGRQIVVATHSVDFIRGVLSSQSAPTLVRLRRVKDVNPATYLSPSDVQLIATDPVSSSAGVLGGLFFSSAVATEADADRAFYEAAAANTGVGTDLHFVAGQGKQSLPRLIRAFRTLDVRTAAILDFDVFRERTEFISILVALGADLGQAEHLYNQYSKIVGTTLNTETTARDILSVVDKRIVEIRGNTDAAEQLRALKRLGGFLKSRADMYADLKDRGIYALVEAVREEMRLLLAEIGRFGLFVVPVGELEQWLTYFKIPASGDKPDWVQAALEALPRLRLSEYAELRDFMNDVDQYSRREALAGSATA